MQLRVWIWYHNWGDDSSTHLYPSEHAARNAVYAYVSSVWNDGGMDEEQMPVDHVNAVNMYFEFHEDMEYYTIYNEVVDFPALDDTGVHGMPENEIVLTANECAAVVAALGKTNYGAVAKELGISKVSACEYMDSAYNKLKD